MIRLLKFQRWNIKDVITEFKEGQVISEDSIPEKTLSDMLRLGYAEIVKEEISKPKVIKAPKNKIMKKKDISNKKIVKELGKKRGRPSLKKKKRRK